LHDGAAHRRRMSRGANGRDEEDSMKDDPKDLKNTPVPTEPDAADLPPGVDRRSFILRTAVVGAAAVLTGRTTTEVEAATAAAAAKPAAKPATAKTATTLSPTLDVVKKSKG